MHPPTKPLLITLLLLFCLSQLQAQTPNTLHKKGDFSIYWGWNLSNYTQSDIRFQGTHYDFTLYDVVAKDRQSTFAPNVYLNPAKMTIPQYNVRIGYFIRDNYQISIGNDHMKYVMQNGQTVRINGYISHSETAYDGIYNHENIVLADSFLLFEHTDGLNYENIELRRFDVLFHKKFFTLSIHEGIGAGILLPRTNTTLLNNPRHDKFHVSGYGIGIVGAVTLTFFNHFFIQSEWKGGYMNMPDIRTTLHREDRAKQRFFFSQYNVVFGANFRLQHTKPPK